MAYLRAAYLGRMACYIDNSTEVTYTTRGERMTTSNAFAKIGAETPRDGLFIVACLMPALLKSKEAIEFLGDGLLSTVTSFGGGEAYLSIASGMFVSSGAVSTADFYGQLVPVANALPGPILVKLLSGIGYLIGVGQGGMTSGFLFALVGFGAGIGATNFVCVVVHTLYSSFTELKTFQVIKQWILPVICGLLITVVLSMLCERLKVTQTVGIGNIPSIFMIMALYFLIKLLTEKYKLNDILLIILAGALRLLC